MLNLKFYGTGRRKYSRARVWISFGNGDFIVNGYKMDRYFRRKVLQELLKYPFKISGTDYKFNVQSTVKGGGLSGQAGAIMHGVSRALSLVDSGKLRGVIKKAGLLTRDSRMVERKKYGQPGARKKYQYSKR
jgi:small subunit ribosomal protein S9